MSASAVRRLAEMMLGPMVIRRHLPIGVGGGVIVVSGKVGGLKYLLKSAGKWDPELLAIAALLVMKGQSVWDVGANVGLFSKAAAFHAGAAGSVLSIEADADAVALLNRSCRYRLPCHADITVLPVAISDSDGFVQFAIANRARAANSIKGFGTTQTGGVREVRTLPCTTLDSLIEHFPAPDVLKIDVEGAELQVLHGGEKVLTRWRPVIYCEVSARTRPGVATLLERCRFQLWDGCGFDGSLNSPGVSQTTGNVVAIPEEKTDAFVSKCNVSK